MPYGLSQRLDRTICLMVVSIVTLHIGPLLRFLSVWVFAHCGVWASSGVELPPKRIKGVKG
jgi:hypothetical protein